MGTGEPSRDRLSGVCTPLEWADSAPVWLGEAGALLQQIILKIRHFKFNNKALEFILMESELQGPVALNTGRTAGRVGS